tara:strand:+ start:597 stop:836 length:240 start_codon:yes stop_codon:yes gene_type:complete
MDKQDINDNLEDVCTIEEFGHRFPYLAFTRERFNHLLRKKNENGIMESGAIVRVGRRYAVRSGQFRAWYNKYININGRP